MAWLSGVWATSVFCIWFFGWFMPDEPDITADLFMQNDPEIAADLFIQNDPEIATGLFMQDDPEIAAGKLIRRTMYEKMALGEES